MKSNDLATTVQRWQENLAFFLANLGISIGPSRLTVVDCDTPGKLSEVQRRFGETPIVIATPRGGVHLWYRSSGERCTGFMVDGCSIDINRDFSGDRATSATTKVRYPKSGLYGNVWLAWNVAVGLATGRGALRR